ncbi:MAG TPA: acetate--CoA ligase family protein [Archangium sp.]|uniref:acetate--CoA ligase family protein n=1 Tax=Archangium sp. TaxID=1872627 RepID=UPI002E2FEA99|nr:acetate--CoA ligase family protein [Archangium sp.]HEX5747309.1 acetate--CoA ligase family protein [Archangium sp.]
MRSTAVVLKLHSHRITHKSEVGGVKLNLGTAREVREAFEAIRGKLDAPRPGGGGGGAAAAGHPPVPGEVRGAVEDEGGGAGGHPPHPMLICRNPGFQIIHSGSVGDNVVKAVKEL